MSSPGVVAVVGELQAVADAAQAALAGGGTACDPLGQQMQPLQQGQEVGVEDVIVRGHEHATGIFVHRNQYAGVTATATA